MKQFWTWAVFLPLALLSLAASAGTTITYYHNDLLGSPVAATDASGHVIWRESYRPYGERLTHDPASTGNDVWYTSRRQDADTGLVYMGARYYDPVAGRFVSKDPVGFDEKNIQSFNRYAYANDNPYKYTDPNGKNPLILWAAGGYGAGVLADAASQYAAWGSVDWKMAMTSSAAQSGIQAGLLGGAGGVELTIEKVGAEAIAAEGSMSDALQIGEKIARQMEPRGWTKEAIQEAIQSGEQIKAVNKATGNAATRYVHPETGQSVVVDETTKEVIHVGGPGFKYGPESGDLP